MYADLVANQHVAQDGVKEVDLVYAWSLFVIRDHVVKGDGVSNLDYACVREETFHHGVEAVTDRIAIILLN